MLARKWSLRLLENSLNPQKALRKQVKLCEIHRTTISKAMEKRSVELFRSHYFHLHQFYESKVFKSRKCGKGLTVIDATSIRMPLNWCSWANFKRNSKAIKVHLVMESGFDIPQFFKISLGTTQEITVARTLVNKFPKDRLLVCDKAYFAFDFFHNLDRRGVKFIVPMKNGLAFKALREVNASELSDDIAADQIVAFTSQIAAKYKPVFRIITYRNPNDGKVWRCLTNSYDLDAELLAEAYTLRWRIEVFFRWIKQNLKIKSFWGSSRNAVEIQIWAALMVYLVMRALSLRTSAYYLYNFIRDKLFERTKLYLSYNILKT
jgi:IS4 transposase